MLKQIILKEIADQVHKLRFLLTASITILLFLACSISFLLQYRQISVEYESPQQLAKSTLENDNLTLDRFVRSDFSILQRPQPLWFCVDGGSDMLPNEFRVGSMYFQEIYPSFHQSRANPLLEKIGTADWVFIITLFISFTAFVLSYDGFSGEKEDGTLRLILSNSIPRHQVLIGKFLGIFFTALIPLIAGQLLSTIIIQFSNLVILQGADWLRIILVAFLSWLFIGVIICVGLFISALTHRSSTSLVVILFVWIMMTIFIPRSSGTLSQVFYDLPRREEINQQANRALTDAYEKMRHVDRYYSKIDRARMQVDALKLRAQIRLNYRHQKFEQIKLAMSLARISPVSTFQYAAESIAAVGLTYHKHLLDRLIVYHQQLDDFVLSEERRISDDPKGLISNRTIERKPFNIRAIPIFQEQPIPIQQS
ncbi:MAG: ABC transporter permease subunit, partial [bacterium]